jgi:HPr kinase/phosphorylase
MARIARLNVHSRGPEAAPASPFLHGTVAVIGACGVLVRGRSGSGKSSLCLSLVEECARLGLFARLVADDRVAIIACGDRLVARPHAVIAGKVERRGQGILAVPYEAAAVIRLVVDLESRDKSPRLPARADLTTTIQGLDCPRLCLPRESSPVDNAQAVLACLRRDREILSKF